MVTDAKEDYAVHLDQDPGTGSKRPGEDMVADFRQQFPGISVPGPSSPPAALMTQHSGVENPGLGVPMPGQSPIVDHSVLGHTVASPELDVPQIPTSQDVFPDQDPTPRASATHWPPFFNSSAPPLSDFAARTNYYGAALVAGTTASVAYDAHSLPPPPPALQELIHNNINNINNSTSMPLPASGAIHPGPMVMNFQAPTAPQFFQTQNPFLQSDAVHHQSSFPPVSFVNHDPNYETVDRDGLSISPEIPMEGIAPMDISFTAQPQPQPQPQPFIRFPPERARAHPAPPRIEKFRYHCTLNAPTAMIKVPDEVPVTYLNKGQAYSITIADRSPIPFVVGTIYRTYIRVSFEEERQRQKPGACWNLWKEGRGANEAHQHGGKIQAVEFVEGAQSSEGDDRRARVELESSSFDGFCVKWAPGTHGNAPECNVAVRFNFLSTDFSHSKGVKGVPVRLCAKTNIVSIAGSPPTEPCTEIRYCKVKLFRDHGAERKLANDVNHVKRNIEKQRQTIELAESGGKDILRRRRVVHGRMQDHQRGGRVARHRRNASGSSTGSEGKNGLAPGSPEEMREKLEGMKDMFSSTHPVSLLYLPGDELDDPDLHPVSLPKRLGENLGTGGSQDCGHWHANGVGNGAGESELVSPVPSSDSLSSPTGGAAQWFDSADDQGDSVNIKVALAGSGDDSVSRWIDVLGADPSFKPPAERQHRPKIAQFFILRKEPGVNLDPRGPYTAVYLTERTLLDFVEQIAMKWNLSATAITRVFRVLDGGLKVVVDDEVIQHLPDSQDMVIEVSEVPVSVPPTKNEWDSPQDGMGEDVDPEEDEFFNSAGLELELQLFYS